MPKTNRIKVNRDKSLDYASVADNFSQKGQNLQENLATGMQQGF